MQKRNVIDNVRVNNAFSFEIMFILKAIKSCFKGSYDEQNLTLVVISYEIYETHQRLVSYISYEMATRVRSSIYVASALHFHSSPEQPTLSERHVFARSHHFGWSSVRNPTVNLVVLKSPKSMYVHH